MKKVFTKEELINLGLPWGDSDKVRVIEDTVYDTSRRWSEDHRLIFRLSDMPENEAWQTYYSVGKTEQQDEQPWEYEDEIECFLVKKTEKMVVVWE